MQKLSEISSAVRGAALKVRAALGFGAGGRPGAAPMRRLLFELAKETDELLALEVRDRLFWGSRALHRSAQSGDPAEQL